MQGVHDFAHGGVGEKPCRLAALTALRLGEVTVKELLITTELPILDGRVLSEFNT